MVIRAGVGEEYDWIVGLSDKEIRDLSLTIKEALKNAFEAGIGSVVDMMNQTHSESFEEYYEKTLKNYEHFKISDSNNNSISDMDNRSNMGV